MKFVGLVQVLYWPHYSDVGTGQVWHAIGPYCYDIPAFLTIGPSYLRKPL